MLIRIAAGQHTELLVVYSTEDIVLIQPLEQRIKLRRSFRQFFIFTLLGVKLPSVFRGAFLLINSANDPPLSVPFAIFCTVFSKNERLNAILIQSAGSLHRFFIRRGILHINKLK